MALRFSPTGVAVYGTGTVAVDGAVPAALTGTVGPAAWEATGILVYQDGGTGAGPWTLKRLTLPATIANIDSSPASVVAGGGGQWAAWEPATGLRTDIAIGPFSAKLLGDVSPDGELLAIDSQTPAGLTVYDNAGASIFADPTVVLQSRQVCLRDSHLSYYDATGWHLIDITTGEPAGWYPRTDGVNWLVPVTHRGVLYVIERSNNLTIRPANKNKGWILSSDPNAFSPDAVSVSSSNLRVGYCTDPSEAASSLVTFNISVTNAATISVATGTIVLGAIVYGSAVTTPATTFTVGPLEGNDLAQKGFIPYNHPVVDPSLGFKLTIPWRAAFQKLDDQVVATSDVLQHFPTPPLGADGYDKVASSGQPTMSAQGGNTTLTFTSADGTFVITLNPATNTIDLGQLAAGYWSELTNGDPAAPELVFAGGDTINMWVPL